MDAYLAVQAIVLRAYYRGLNAAYHDGHIPCQRCEGTGCKIGRMPNLNQKIIFAKSLCENCGGTGFDTTYNNDILGFYTVGDGLALVITEAKGE